MSWIQHQINQRDGVLGYPPPLSPPSSYGDTFHKEPSRSSSSSSGTRISPAVLFIIIILAVLFFISGLLHLLVRFLMKHPTSSTQSNDRYPEVSSSDALQRQLQQLFHLHDSGLDQAFIDALPVFMYKEIVGASKEPFDCAVCLCEFSGKDKLRLLPMCSHAFHINCIDTWLLTNSTCPLCRGTLFTPGLNIENPIFDFDDLREDDGFPSNGENGFVLSQKTVEIEEIIREKGVIPVRLGKFRKLDDGVGERDVGETSSSNLDARRCYSMGSYQYVVGDTNLRVPLSIDREGRDMKRVKGIEYNNNPTIEGDDVEGKKISIGSKTDSYSVSKIWLWSKKGKFASSSETQ
ncbi:hypothetical protein ACSBR2_022644 [Camellia fascicularis]